MIGDNDGPNDALSEASDIYRQLCYLLQSLTIIQEKSSGIARLDLGNVDDREVIEQTIALFLELIRQAGIELITQNSGEKARASDIIGQFIRAYMDLVFAPMLANLKEENRDFLNALPSLNSIVKRLGRLVNEDELQGPHQDLMDAQQGGPDQASVTVESLKAQFDDVLKRVQYSSYRKIFSVLALQTTPVQCKIEILHLLGIPDFWVFPGNRSPFECFGYAGESASNLDKELLFKVVRVCGNDIWPYFGVKIAPQIINCKLTSKEQKLRCLMLYASQLKPIGVVLQRLLQWLCILHAKLDAGFDSPPAIDKTTGATIRGIEGLYPGWGTTVFGFFPLLGPLLLTLLLHSRYFQKPDDFTLEQSVMSLDESKTVALIQWLSEASGCCYLSQIASRYVSHCLFWGVVTASMLLHLTVTKPLITILTLIGLYIIGGLCFRGCFDMMRFGDICIMRYGQGEALSLCRQACTSLICLMAFGFSGRLTADTGVQPAHASQIDEVNSGDQEALSIRVFCAALASISVLLFAMATMPLLVSCVKFFYMKCCRRPKTHAVDLSLYLLGGEGAAFGD